MIQTLEKISIEDLELMLAQKEQNFNHAYNQQRPSFELNELYKQLKTIRIEVNLRKIS
jgi:hypothetical protein